jgi:tRNA A37 threonylcarbamoyladenosine synthetase subunit TsaC/SUA5/YrdC
MWFLLLILLDPPTGFDKRYLLDTLPSQEQCNDSKQIVEDGMKAAYPLDTNYMIVCIPKAQV